MPTTAMSMASTSSIRGSWAKVGGPANRGTLVLSSCPTWSPVTTRGIESDIGLPLLQLVDRLPLGLAVAEDLPVRGGVRVLDDGGGLRLAGGDPARAVRTERVARLGREEEQSEGERRSEPDGDGEADVDT